MDVNAANIQTIEADWLTKSGLFLDVLRLDKIHEIVSGNKWFKLKYYLNEAILNKKQIVATFGGAWSNHIIATAFAAREAGLKSIGIIRGEKPKVLSFTLIMAMKYGMELQFVTRDQYKQKQQIIEETDNKDWFWIDEGGFGLTGVKGAAEILKVVDTSAYTHIIASVGTGTMLAGLITASTETQKIIGISSMKGNYLIEQKIKDLIGLENDDKKFLINHDYHFGGYGKHPEQLINFINEIFIAHQLPLDIIYTGKTMFAIKDFADKKLFQQCSKLLMIHSGGLQGNKSLGEKVLAF